MAGYWLVGLSSGGFGIAQGANGQPPTSAAGSGVTSAQYLGSTFRDVQANWTRAVADTGQVLGYEVGPSDLQGAFNAARQSGAGIFKPGTVSSAQAVSDLTYAAAFVGGLVGVGITGAGGTGALAGTGGADVAAGEAAAGGGAAGTAASTAAKALSGAAGTAAAGFALDKYWPAILKVLEAAALFLGGSLLAVLALRELGGPDIPAAGRKAVRAVR